MTVSGSAAALPAPVTSQAPKSNWDAFVDQTSANVADKGTWDPFAVPDVSAAAAAPTDSWDVFSVTPGAGSSTVSSYPFVAILMVKFKSVLYCYVKCEAIVE